MLIEYGGEELQSVERFRLAAAGLQVGYPPGFLATLYLSLSEPAGALYV